MRIFQFERTHGRWFVKALEWQYHTRKFRQPNGVCAEEKIVCVQNVCLVIRESRVTENRGCIGCGYKQHARTYVQSSTFTLRPRIRIQLWRLYVWDCRYFSAFFCALPLTSSHRVGLCSLLLLFPFCQLHFTFCFSHRIYPFFAFELLSVYLCRAFDVCFFPFVVASMLCVATEQSRCYSTNIVYLLQSIFYMYCIHAFIAIHAMPTNFPVYLDFSINFIDQNSIQSISFVRNKCIFFALIYRDTSEKLPKYIT